MSQLPCVFAARPLLAVPAARGPGPWPWHGGALGRANVAGSARRGVGLGLRAAAPARPVVEAEADEEEDAVVEEERYALGGACRVLAGMPAPLGATALDGGVNFAVYSAGTSAASLCLFTPNDLKEDTVTEEVPLDPLLNRAGNVWLLFT